MNAHCTQHTRGSLTCGIRLATEILVAVALVLTAAGAAHAQRCLQRVPVDGAGDFDLWTDLQQDWAVLGDAGDDSAGTNAGAASVFRRDDNGTPADREDDLWLQHAKLVASDVSSRFGSPVALTPASDWLAVGAPYDDARRGALYLFRRVDPGTPGDLSDDTWVEFTKIVPTDIAEHDSFGREIAIDDRFLFSSSTDDDDLGDDSGSVYVYYHDDAGTPDTADDQWLFLTKLNHGDAEAYDHFGLALAMFGDFFVGAIYRGSPYYQGALYFFRHDDSGTPTDFADDQWVQHQKIDTPTWADGIRSMALNDTFTVAGERTSALVYARDDGGTPLDASDDLWVSRPRISASAHIGESIDLYEELVAVGASSYYGTYVFQRHDNGTPMDPLDDNWTEVRRLRPQGWGSLFTTAVAIYDGVLLTPGTNVAGDEFSAFFDLALLGGPDCNANTEEDACDILAGVSADDNQTGIPDECEVAACCIHGLGTACDILAAMDCLAGGGIAGPVDSTCFSPENPEGFDCRCYSLDDCGIPPNLACTTRYLACEEGVCIVEPKPYGDVNGDGAANVFDIFCQLDIIAGEYGGDCTIEGADINPCEGNGFVKLFDIFAVLDAICGIDRCCTPGACCLPDDSCVDVARGQDCWDDLYGDFAQGETCATITCPLPP